MEKLAFFSPDNKKDCLKVMLFGPVNGKSFYSCMMDNFKNQSDTLFIQVTESRETKGNLGEN